MRAWILPKYIRDDGPEYTTGYPRVAFNRFRRARVSAQSLIPPKRTPLSRSGQRFLVTPDDTEIFFVPTARANAATARVIGCSPTLARFPDELFATELVQLPDGQIISFSLFRFSGHDDEGPLWLDGFVYRRRDCCLWYAEEPATIDLDHGGSAREVWDVFDYKGSRYVVAVRYDYEERWMELFRVVDDHLVRDLEFWYACLGCD